MQAEHAELLIVSLWVGFAIAAGLYAYRLDRNVVLWTFIGLLCSLLAFVFLFALGENTEGEDRP